MSILLKRILPFLITLGVGVTLSLFALRSFYRQSKSYCISQDLMNSEKIGPSGLTILSLPEFDFTDAARRTSGFSGSIRLQAVLDADGTVREVKPIKMLPYGVREESLAAEERNQITPFMVDGKFVRSLPYGLTDASIESAKKIQFTPTIIDGKPMPVRVTIVNEFNLITSPDCVQCSSIDTYAFDDSGKTWQKHSWVENTDYYKTHRVRIER